MQRRSLQSVLKSIFWAGRAPMLRAGLASVAFTAIAFIGADCADAETTKGGLN